MGSRYWSLGSPQAGTEENNQGYSGPSSVHQPISREPAAGLIRGDPRTQGAPITQGAPDWGNRHGHAEHYGVIPGIKISVSNSRHHANRFQVLGY
uniref:Uncharacterized protein n=1 Tax=Oryza meridionalis TaxID=40149 RepID=A0A0E0EKN7_9ORYZ